MAVNAKTNDDIIGMTNAMLDSMTAEVIEIEFAPVLQEIQATKAIIDVAESNWDSTIHKLNNTPRSYRNPSGVESLMALIESTEYRFDVGMRDGKLVQDTEHPLLVLKIPISDRLGTRGAKLAVYRYITGEVTWSKMIQAILKEMQAKTRAQFRKFMVGTPSIWDVLSGRLPHQLYSDHQIMEGIIATPTYLYKTPADVWDNMLPNWTHYLERYIIGYLDLESDKTKTAFDDFIPAVGNVLDRLSDAGRDALYRKMAHYMVEEMEIDALTRYFPVPDSIVAEVVGEQLKSAGDVELTMEAYVTEAGRYKLVVDTQYDYQANFLTLRSGHIDSNKYSRLLVNPDALTFRSDKYRDHLQPGDRLVFTQDRPTGQTLLGQLRQYASCDLVSYLNRRHDTKTSLALTPVTTHFWFRLISETEYQGKVTVVIAAEEEFNGLQVSEELDVAIKRTLEHEIEAVRDNWDKLSAGLGSTLAFDKDRYEEFWSSVDIQVVCLDTAFSTPVTVIKAPMIEAR